MSVRHSNYISCIWTSWRLVTTIWFLDLLLILLFPLGIVFRLFKKLFKDNVISKKSFELWKKEDKFKAGFIEDLETITMAAVAWNSFFLSLATDDYDEKKSLL